MMWIGLGLALTGCGSGGGPTAPATLAVTVKPTLTNIQRDIFNRSCALPSCHSSVAQRGGLVLEEGRAYAQLINAPAENDSAKAARKLRVVPGRPEESFLMGKLTGPGPGEGRLMPYATEGLDASQIEAIRRWIQQGAQPE